MKTVPNKIRSKMPKLTHTIIKMPKVKDKERILKARRKKQLVTYMFSLIRITADILTEILQERRDWQEIFKVMRSKNIQPRVLTQQN